MGHDVWIAEGCIVKSGVKIGTGAVIGMGSFVTKDIPPYSLAVGNSACVIVPFPIKYRFDEKDSKWWDLKDSEI